jgi:hypothetical protein
MSLSREGSLHAAVSAIGTEDQNPASRKTNANEKRVGVYPRGAAAETKHIESS